MVQINCVFDGLYSRGNIYLSNCTAAYNEQLIHKFSIGAVLALDECQIVNKSHSYYLFLKVKDKQHVPLEQIIEKTYKFIDNARKKTNVVIYCNFNGNSLSGAIAIAYLMKKFHYSFAEVYSLIKRKKPNINLSTQIADKLKSIIQPQKKHILSQAKTQYHKCMSQSLQKNPFNVFNSRANSVMLPKTYVKKNIQKQQTRKPIKISIINPQKKQSKENFTFRTLMENPSAITQYQSESKFDSNQQFPSPIMRYTENNVMSHSKTHRIKCIIEQIKRRLHEQSNQRKSLLQKGQHKLYTSNKQKYKSGHY